MPATLQNPSFFAYVITTLVLCINLIFLWTYSGTVRAKSGAAINPEDSEKYRVPLSEADPAPVARVLRAHRNAEATIYPFLILGLIFVLAGGSAMTAEVIFTVFTAARLLHSAAYLKGKQPWRSITFGISGVALIALMVCIVLLLIHRPAL